MKNPTFQDESMTAFQSVLYGDRLGTERKEKIIFTKWKVLDGDNGT